MKNSILIFKFLFAVLVLVGFLTSSTLLPGFARTEKTENLIQKDEVFQTDSYKIYNFDQYDITVIAPNKKFDFLYHPHNAPSLKNVAARKKYSLVLNGSFYGGTNLKAIHAGLLNRNGQQLAPLDPEDKELTHIIRYNTKTKTLDFHNRENFVSKSSDQNILEFQAGPLMAQNGKITPSFIENSKNGLGQYSRTLLGVNSDQEKFFIVVRSRVNLKELSNFLLSTDLFKDKNLNLMNLDGGPSVALYSKEFPALNFNEDKRLPILFGLN